MSVTQCCLQALSAGFSHTGIRTGYGARPVCGTNHTGDFKTVGIPGCNHLISVQTAVWLHTMKSSQFQHSKLFINRIAGSIWEGPQHVPLFIDRKSTRLNSSHVAISYAVFCLKK